MRAKKRVTRDEYSRGNYALISLVALLAVITVGSFVVQTSQSPLYSAKPRIAVEGGSGNGAMADLTITDIVIPNGTYAGNPITIVAVVKNIGNYPAVGQMSQGWSFITPNYGGFGGTGCCSNISLNPGQTTTIYYTLTTNISGNWNVSASVGAQNFLEQNYNNNARSKSFYVYPALPDITPPIISNVVSISHPNSANIVWNTNEVADSFVFYGLTSGVYTNNVSNYDYVISHNILINDLTSGTAYYYQIRSSDIYGNIAFSHEYAFNTLAMNGTGNNS